MRVLLWMIGGDVVPGGHRVQIESTARALRSLGISADVEYGLEPDLKAYDVVHGFGLPLEAMRACRSAGVPIVLSTIWWSRAYKAGLTHELWRPGAVAARARLGASFAVAALRGRHVDKTWRWMEQWQQDRVRYEMADMLLPNSASEAEMIKADLEVTTPMTIVPNAVDPELFNQSGDSAHCEATREGVLYVGRIEPHKNQLGLIRAMRKSSLKISIVGPGHPHHGAYLDRCRRNLRSNITLHGAIEHEHLPPLFRRHKVHVLPSWFETTGLVSLEAALCGCNIVTTERGYARDYLGDFAWYCDPSKPESIREAVEAAHAAPFNPKLAEMILGRFTWQDTAEATIEAYERVLHSIPSKTQESVAGLAR